MLTLQGGDSLVGGLPIIHITYQQYIANPSAYHDPDVIVHISGFPTAGNLPADYVGYDVNLNMEDIGNIATKAIAKVEPNDTALYLHEVGTGFINKDGNYCLTDVQIAVGGTIALGTNCHVVDGGISGNLAYKQGDVINISGSYAGTTNGIGTYLYFVIPLSKPVDASSVTSVSINSVFIRDYTAGTEEKAVQSATATVKPYGLELTVILSSATSKTKNSNLLFTVSSGTVTI